MCRCRTGHDGVRLLVLFPRLLTGMWAQQWDLGAQGAAAVSEGTNNKLKPSFEQRGRYEARTGNTFGTDSM